MRSEYLICYDIADPARLARVYRFLKGQCVHLQYSVFVASLTWPELQALKAHLARLINSRADDVRIYPLPQRDALRQLGLGDRTPEGAWVHFS